MQIIPHFYAQCVESDKISQWLPESDWIQRVITYAATVEPSYRKWPSYIALRDKKNRYDAYYDSILRWVGNQMIRLYVSTLRSTAVVALWLFLNCPYVLNYLFIHLFCILIYFCFISWELILLLLLLLSRGVYFERGNGGYLIYLQQSPFKRSTAQGCQS